MCIRDRHTDQANHNNDQNRYPAACGDCGDQRFCSGDNRLDRKRYRLCDGFRCNNGGSCRSSCCLNGTLRSFDRSLRRFLRRLCGTLRCLDGRFSGALCGFTVFCAVFAEPFPTVLIVFFPAERAVSFTAFFGCSTALIL